MSAEQVALIPQCEECLAIWMPADEERWQAHCIDDGPEEKLVSYCPECGEREFGEWRSRE
jgi:predicted  nucleic acid-binding Zn-ribbon protein